MTIIHSYPYTIGTSVPLSNDHVTDLIRLFETPVADMDAPLEGRATSVHTRIESIGDVVIKHYRRGGFISRFNKNSYLRSGKPRSRLEYEMLEKTRGIGVNTPEPLIWAIRGGLFYKAFLVTREIPNVKSLMSISMAGDIRIEEIIKKTAREMGVLIKNHIHHVDLHPGNVLVDDNDRVYLIDFDKAEKSTLSSHKLILAYLKRWKRAAGKYSLPQSMTDIMEKELSVLFKAQDIQVASCDD